MQVSTSSQGEPEEAGTGEDAVMAERAQPPAPRMLSWWSLWSATPPGLNCHGSVSEGKSLMEGWKAWKNPYSSRIYASSIQTMRMCRECESKGMCRCPPLKRSHSPGHQRTATAIGRSMAAMVAMGRHLWVNLASIGEKEKAFLLDAPVLPSELFGTSVEAVVGKIWGALGRIQIIHTVRRRSKSTSRQPGGPGLSRPED